MPCHAGYHAVGDTMRRRYETAARHTGEFLILEAPVDKRPIHVVMPVPTEFTKGVRELPRLRQPKWE